MNDEANGKFASMIKAALEDDLNRLDARTVARLRAARRRALGQTDRQGHAVHFHFLQAAAVACVMGIAVLVMWPRTEPAPMLASNNADDSDVLFQARDRIELYRDLDFYRWLAANDQHS